NHTGVVGEPDGFKPVVQDLFRLHSAHHFCYSLSSIPLHGRLAGGGCPGSRTDCLCPCAVSQTVGRRVGDWQGLTWLLPTARKRCANSSNSLTVCIATTHSGCRRCASQLKNYSTARSIRIMLTLR